MLAGIALLPFVGRWVGIQPDQILLAMLYCTLLPTMASATPTEVLRALDRFDLISWADTVAPISRAIIVLIVYLSGAPFIAYLAAWYISTLTGDVYDVFIAWRELRRRGLVQGIRPTLRPSTLPGAWRFAIHVNLTSSISGCLGPNRSAGRGRTPGPCGSSAVSGRLIAVRQRRQARRPPGEGLLP